MIRGFFAALLLSSQLAAADTTATQAAEKPNIVIIFTDDMGYGDISSFADRLKVKTPNIDRLAAEGMKFTQFYVSSPICSPSRAALLSGMNAPETGLTSYLQERKGNRDSDQEDYLNPQLAYMPRAFKQAGYATAHVGKWHLGGGRDVDNAPSIGQYGYDEFYSTWESPDRDPKLGTTHAPWDKRLVPGQVERHDRTRYMVDRTLDFLKRNDGKPAFVTLWPDDLHTPFRPSPAMLEKHGGSEDRDRSMKNFLGVLEEYDRQIGRLLDGLREQGSEENTIVIFTGDNGPAPHFDHQRNDGMRGMKLSLYEGGIRQPFLIRWPKRIPAGKSDEETVLSALDLLPSLAALADVQLPAEAKERGDGEDLSVALLGTPTERSKPLLFEYGRTAAVPRPKDAADQSPSLGIRKGRYKLLVEPDNSRHELYDIPKDRFESTNLADELTTLAQQLAKEVIGWSKKLPHRTHPFPAP